MGEIIEGNFGKGPLNWPDEPTPAQVEQITNLFEEHAKKEGFHPTRNLNTGLLVTQFIIGQNIEGVEKMAKYLQLITEEVNRRYPVGEQTKLAM